MTLIQTRFRLCVPITLSVDYVLFKPRRQVEVENLILRHTAQHRPPAGRRRTSQADGGWQASHMMLPLILPQARIPADGVFGNDSGFEPSHQEFVSVVPCDRWQIVHAPAAGSGADLLALSPHRTIAVAIGHNLRRLWGKSRSQNRARLFRRLTRRWPSGRRPIRLEIPLALLARAGEVID